MIILVRIKNRNSISLLIICSIPDLVEFENLVKSSMVQRFLKLLMEIYEWICFGLVYSLQNHVVMVNSLVSLIVNCLIALRILLLLVVVDHIMVLDVPIQPLSNGGDIPIAEVWLRNKEGLHLSIGNLNLLDKRIVFLRNHESVFDISSIPIEHSCIWLRSFH